MLVILSAVCVILSAVCVILSAVCVILSAVLFPLFCRKMETSGARTELFKAQFNIQQLYVLPTQFIYVFCVDLRINSDYFPIQH